MKNGKSRPTAVSRLAWLLRPLRGHSVLVFSLGVALAVLTFGTVWVWEAVRPRVLDTPEYQLDPQKIVINTPPAWITADDVRREAVRDASLDGPLSIMDEKLPERIALAFAAHPWVAHVERVEKFHPARVVVTLVYRVPAACVATGTDLWPIDRTGVLLPRENLSRVELLKLPRIGGLAVKPAVRPGNTWPDARVLGAARVADAIGDLWQRFDLAEIVPSMQPVRGQRSVYTYELLTQGGKRIAWGRQPLDDDPGEPSPAEKLKRLKTYVEQHGSLNGITIDAEPTPGSARTARAAQPADRPR